MFGFVFFALSCLFFTSNSAFFIDEGAKISYDLRALGTLATPRIRLSG